MSKVTITSVSPAVAKRALDKIVRKNGMFYTDKQYTSANSANSSVLDVYLRPEAKHYSPLTGFAPDAPLNVVVLTSNYYGAGRLEHYANEVACSGEVCVVSE